MSKTSSDPKKPEAPSLYDDIKRHLALTLGRDRFTTNPKILYQALSHAVRDRLVERWLATQQQYYFQDVKRVYYLSMEFLIGRTLGNAILNLDIAEDVRKTLMEFGYELEDIESREPDAGLGNGGLGRLAACFMESLASLEYPAYGYGLRYEFGIFHQLVRDGYQVEEPDNWLANGNPWEICRPEAAMKVSFGGHIEERLDRATNRHVVEWYPSESVVAMPYDIPVPGFHKNTVNTLRLWSARASTNEFNLSLFNEGAYVDAIEERALAENITKILYPNDSVAQGRELRLRQQYFMTAATLKDILRRYLKYHKDFRQFANKTAIQLNDTHPAIAIPELMRLLVDKNGLNWDSAWELTTKVFAYTNHTLLEEALEKWSVELIERLLPRHMQIIYEINARFLREVANKFPGNLDRLRRMSLILESTPRQVRMAYLAIVASHSVNGVARLHTDLLKTQLVRDFYETFPERFNSKTNGISPRRWISYCNPELSELITSRIGDSWTRNLRELEQLRSHAEDPTFRAAFREIKLRKKRALADQIQREMKIDLDPESMFDVQIKRIHEYKRQLLAILNTVALYLRLKSSPCPDFVPRTVIISGKAAPGYFMAKLIIKLANSIADVVNHDPETRDKLKLVFMPDYRVSLAEKIIPAADLSEQISTAGKEASGTGNMKLALNGALTVGTLDGANIEMLAEVGEENMFIFGLTVEEIAELREQGYVPRDHLANCPELQRVLTLIESGHFDFRNPQLFEPILHNLLDGGDPYMVIADFDAYSKIQDEVSDLFRDADEWSRRAILNVAGMGYFSSDRTIEEYAREIWGLEKCPIDKTRVDWDDELPERGKAWLKEKRD